MRFGFGINPQNVHDVAAAAGEADRLGFDRIGLWDSPLAHREVWVTLAAVAAATSRIRIGPWVTNSATRHPVVTAAAAATLDDLAPGRVVLGVGSGDSGVYNLGHTATGLDRLADFVGALRGLLSEGEACWDGQDVSLDWPGHRDIPVFVSAHGPKSLELAGRVADGVVVGTGVRPEDIAWAMTAIGRGCAAAGRSPSDLEIWWLAPWYIAEDRQTARTDALWHLSSLVHHWSRIRGGANFPDNIRAGVMELGSRYRLRSHGEPSSEEKATYADAATQLGVADYLLRRFTFSGTAAEVGDQMKAAAGAGAQNLDCANPAPANRIMQRPAAFHRQVLPLLRGGTELAAGGAGRG